MSPDASPRHVAGRGTGAVTRKPDVAYIQLYVRSAGILLADAVAESASKSAQVVTSLRAAHPSITRLCVTDVLVGESQDYSPSRADKPQPEVVRAILIVVPPQPALAVAIVDSASRLGCTFQNTSSRMSRMYPQNAIRYALADFAGAEEEAVALAIEDARVRVNRVSKAASLTLGPLWFISIGSHGERRPYEREAEVEWPGESLSDYTSVSDQAITVEQTVELRYLIA